MNIAFFGTGLLGLPMAERLLEAGHALTVYNRTFERGEPLARRGARLAQSPRMAWEFCSCGILMVPDAAAIKSVLLDEAGRSLAQKRTVIQMGTIAPDESRAIAELVESAGGEYLEAPVLGSIPQAVARQLVVMVGGSPEQFERWSALFGAFGNPVVRAGVVGQAASLKLALNQLIASLTTAFAFSLALVEKENVDVELFMSILRGSALYAPTFDKKLNAYLKRDYAAPNFPLKHMRKDVGLMLAAGADLGVATGPLEGVRAVLDAALRRGLGDLDYSALYEAVRESGGSQNGPAI